MIIMDSTGIKPKMSSPIASVPRGGNVKGVLLTAGFWVAGFYLARRYSMANRTSGSQAQQESIGNPQRLYKNQHQYVPKADWAEIMDDPTDID